MASSPTARTLKLLRDAGYTAAVVERWNVHAKVRQDLFGFIDVLGLRADQPLLAIQCTTVAHQADRLTKLSAIPAARTWLLAGNRLEVWGFKKRRGLWDVTRRVVGVEDLEPARTA